MDCHLNRRGTTATLLAKLTAFALIAGSNSVGFADPPCRCCPPIQNCPPATYPAPTEIQTAPPSISDPSSQPSEGESPAIADPLTGQDDFVDLDLSSAMVSNFGAGGATQLAFAEKRSSTGYIDTALVRTQARFRFDAAYDFNRADRAEFFYTTWDLFGGENPSPPGVPEPDIDRQSLSLYFEHAFGNDEDISLFVDLPVIFSDPLFNSNDQGIGDLQVGLKLSLIENRCSQLTFQLKNYIPTADNTNRWLGAGHYSIEPGLLYFRDLGNGLTLETEIRDWISIGGAVNPNNGKNYAGNVLRYGLGVGYLLGCVGGHKVTPIVETVGWTVLDGQVFEFNDSQIDPDDPTAGRIGPRSAVGDTIVNIKLGTRFENSTGGSIYAGYGRSLTGDRWYRDIFRLELRKML
jgi:hypothetical protein